MDNLQNIIKDLKTGNNEYIKKLKPLSKRICVIYGLNGSGKDSIKDELIKTGKFNYNIKCTTRRVKNGEVPGIDYHYYKLGSKEFLTSRENAIVSYSYTGNYYWDDAKQVYEDLNENPNKYVIIIMGNIIGLKEFLKLLPNVNKICILPTKDDTLLIQETKKRMVKRGRDTPKLIEERLKLALPTINLLKDTADLIVYNEEGKLAQSVSQITQYLMNNSTF